MRDEHERNAGEEPDPPEKRPTAEAAGERDLFRSTGPQPGPGDSDGGGSD